MDGNRQYTYNIESPVLEERMPVEHVSVKQLQHLVQLLDESDVSEIEVKRAEAGMHLVLRKAKVGDHATSGEYPVAVSATENDEKPAVAESERQHPIPAPLVGIFHTWAKPKGKALVSVGDKVKVGQLVGTIQSLNVLVEVESPIAGRIAELYTQDGQAVEYGQTLMVVDSTEEA